MSPYGFAHKDWPLPRVSRIKMQPFCTFGTRSVGLETQNNYPVPTVTVFLKSTMVPKAGGRYSRT